MRKLKNYIIILALLFCVLAIAKHVVLDVLLPGYYYVLEYLSYLVFFVFIFVYSKRNDFYMSQIEDGKLKFDAQEKLYVKQINELKDVVSGYELAASEALRFQNRTEAFFKDFMVMAKSKSSAKTIAEDGLKLICKYFEIVGGLVYLKSEKNIFEPYSRYALDEEVLVESFISGDGLHGQAVLSCKPSVISDIPEDYFDVESGIGKSKPKYIYFLPFKTSEGAEMLFELASFKALELDQLWGELCTVQSELK